MVDLMSIEGASDEVQADLREILPIDFPLSSFDLDLEAIRARAVASSVSFICRFSSILSDIAVLHS